MFPLLKKSADKREEKMAALLLDYCLQHNLHWNAAQIC